MIISIHTNGMLTKVRIKMARNKYSEETVALIVSEALKLFIEKGYENTSIQDIINHLGGLSKGAIYHHFKSKKEIFVAVCERIGESNTAYFDDILANKATTGAEKLQEMISSVYNNPNNEVIHVVVKTMTEDPEFFMNNIKEIYELVAPQYIQPVLEEGMRDGSIVTNYPKELAEVVITLLNVWINPLINKGSKEDMKNRFVFLKIILGHLGADVLSDEMMEKCMEHCESYFPDNI